jgi:hypothetical protein
MATEGLQAVVRLKAMIKIANIFFIGIINLCLLIWNKLALTVRYIANCP